MMARVAVQTTRSYEWFLSRCTYNAYEGKPETAAERSKEPTSLEDALQNFNLKLVPWNGRSFYRITFDGRRVAALLVPASAKITRPDGSGRSALDKATASMHSAYDRINGLAGTEAGANRGSFSQITCGITLGNGNSRPGNRVSTGVVKETSASLLSDAAIQEVTASVSELMHSLAPAVHNRYRTMLDSLLADNPTLRPPFMNSVFAATTFNLGPNVVTHIHRDYHNLSGGLCAITALGKYDPRMSGHLILWDLNLIIEFPPGATILLASAVLRHSNLPTRSCDTRMSVVQYSAGSLFRYVDDGFRLRKGIRIMGTADELAAMAEADARRAKALWEDLPVQIEF